MGGSESLFDQAAPGQTSSGSSGSSGSSPVSAARRLKTLLYTAPIHELEFNKGRRGETWLPYDLRSLQLAAIEYVVNRQGFEGGVARPLAEEEISQLAARMVPTDHREMHRTVAALVMSWLLNEEESDAGFSYAYSDTAQSRPVTRSYAVELLREREMADSSLLVKATAGAINLLIGALDIDVADAQKAEERMLDEYISAGRFGDAAQLARRARYRSIQYAETIQAMLEIAQHDLTRVDWAGDVMEEISSAQAHISGRLEDEGRMRYRLDEMRSEIGEPERLRTVIELVDLIDDCHRRHTLLHSKLMKSADVFLAEQVRQRFQPPPSLVIVSMNREVLHAVLRLSSSQALSVASGFLTSLTGPHSPEILHLSHLVNDLLQPRREFGEEEREAPILDLTQEERARFSAATLDRTRSTFVGVDQTPERLSVLFARARALASSEEKAEVLELVRLGALWAFAPDPGPMSSDGLLPGRALSVDDGTPLDDPDFGGSDLLVGSFEELAHVD